MAEGGSSGCNPNHSQAGLDGHLEGFPQQQDLQRYQDNATANAEKPRQQAGSASGQDAGQPGRQRDPNSRAVAEFPCIGGLRPAGRSTWPPQPLGVGDRGFAQLHQVNVR